MGRPYQTCGPFVFRGAKRMAGAGLRAMRCEPGPCVCSARFNGTAVAFLVSIPTQNERGASCRRNNTGLAWWSAWRRCWVDVPTGMMASPVRPDRLACRAYREMPGPLVRRVQRVPRGQRVQRVQRVRKDRRVRRVLPVLRVPRVPRGRPAPQALRALRVLLERLALQERRVLPEPLARQDLPARQGQPVRHRWPKSVPWSAVLAIPSARSARVRWRQ